MKILLLIHAKMPTVVGILTCMRGKNNILALSEPEKAFFYFFTYEHLKFHAQLSWAWKKVYNLGDWFLIAISKVGKMMIIRTRRDDIKLWDIGRNVHLWIYPTFEFIGRNVHGRTVQCKIVRDRNILRRLLLLCPR